MPVTTDIKTLELFARALQSFSDSSASQTTTYRRSTVGLSLMSSILLAVIGMQQAYIQGQHRDREEVPVVQAEMPLPVATPVPVDTSDLADEVAELGTRQDALARLQIAQADYLAEVLVATSRRRAAPEKPASLLQAEAEVSSSAARP